MCITNYVNTYVPLCNLLDGLLPSVSTVVSWLVSFNAVVVCQHTFICVLYYSVATVLVNM